MSQNKTSFTTQIPFCWSIITPVSPDDQPSSGQSSTVPQGFDHKAGNETSHGYLPVNEDDDEMAPETPKEEKTFPGSSVDPPQVRLDSSRHGESYRGPDSDQLPVPASFKELRLLKVPTDLHNAAETLLRYHRDRDNDPNIKKFFKTLGKACQESDSAKSSKTSSSHAGTVKVHKILTGTTFGADEALLKHLNCKELKMTDRQECDIIILFCPIKTRVGSDVELAMRRVSGEERVILVLMHHTRDVDYSTAEKRWSETFNNVVFDINVLFHETVPGLLTCPKNTEAISDIRKRFMQYRHNTTCTML